MQYLLVSIVELLDIALLPSVRFSDYLVDSIINNTLARTLPGVFPETLHLQPILYLWLPSQLFFPFSSLRAEVAVEVLIMERSEEHVACHNWKSYALVKEEL